MGYSYSLTKRLVAHILLFSLLLQSCLQAPVVGPVITTQGNQAPTKKAVAVQASIDTTLAEDPSGTALVKDLPASVGHTLVQPMVVEKQPDTLALANLGNGLGLAQNALMPLEQQVNNYRVLKEKKQGSSEKCLKQARKPIKAIANRQEVQAAAERHEVVQAKSIPKLSPTQVLKAKEGSVATQAKCTQERIKEVASTETPYYPVGTNYQVKFIRAGGVWLGVVQEHVFDLFQRTLYLPVFQVWDKSQNAIGLLEDLGKHSPLWYKHHMHICTPEQDPKKKGYVVVGKLGLVGGMQPGLEHGARLEAHASQATPLHLAVVEAIHKGASALDLATQHDQLEISELLPELGLIESLEAVHETEEEVKEENNEHSSTLNLDAKNDPLFGLGKTVLKDLAQGLQSLQVTLQNVEKIDKPKKKNNKASPSQAAVKPRKLVLRNPWLKLGDVLSSKRAKKTPLSSATEQGPRRLVKKILAQSANMPSKNYAYSDRFKELFQELEEIDKKLAQLECCEEDGNASTPNRLSLHAAAEQGNLKVCKLLLTQGANPNVVGKNAATPLILASRYGHVEVVNVLLSQGADPNIADKDAQTPLHWASRSKHVEVVKFLLAQGADPDIADKDAQTPLILASRYGPVEVVNVLLAQGADPDKADKNGKTPLILASSYGRVEVVKLLLAQGADPDKADKDAQTPLHWASRSKHVEVVKLLLAQGADPDKADKDTQTPLFWAAYSGHAEVVKCFLAKLAQGIDANKADKNGKTPLHWAAYSGHAEVVKCFLAKLAQGIDANKADKNGKTPLHWAAYNGHAEVVKCFLAKLAQGIDATKADNSGYTPLHIAASNGRVEVVKCFLAKLAQGVDANKADNAKLTPLHRAAEQGHVEVVKCFLGKLGQGIDATKADNSGYTPLHIAASNGRVEVVKYFLEQLAQGIDANKADNAGYTPLHRAAYNGHAEVVKCFLAKLGQGVDATKADNAGLTPLHSAAAKGRVEVVKYFLEQLVQEVYTATTPFHLAAKNGHVAVVKLLLNKGVKAHIVDKDGNTALHLAAISGQVAVVNLLLEYGASAYITNKANQTPLDLATRFGYEEIVALLKGIIEFKQENKDTAQSALALYKAAEQGQVDVVKLLLASGADPNMLNNNSLLGYTPLHIAAEQGQLAVVKLLLASEINTEVGDKYGKTPLHVAAEQGQLAVVKLLLANGVKTDVGDNNGKMPLHVAAEKGQLAVVKLLLANGVKTDVGDNNGKMPLHMAVKQGQLAVVELLLASGVNAELGDQYQATPLHVAAEQGQLAVVELLLASGFNTEVGDNQGKTPLHVAVKKGQLAVVKLLLASGVNTAVGDNQGKTPLHLAVEQGQLAVVKLLLASGVNTEVKDNHGKTPLHLAVEQGQLAVVKLLLASGVDAEVGDNHGKTPLHLAVEQGQLAVVKLLLASGVNTEVKDNDGKTPLHVAAEQGQLAEVKLLLEGGANPNVGDNHGKTPLHVAAEKGQLAVVKLLLATKGVTLGAADKNRRTPLYQAVEKEQLAVAEILLVELDQHMGEAITNAWQQIDIPLHLAAEEGKLTIVKLLLDNLGQGIDLNTLDQNGYTPLHIAAKQGYLELVEEFVNRGSDINIQDGTGATALHGAIESGNLKLVEALIALGANKQAKDARGSTPLHKAVLNQHAAIVRYLVAIQADVAIKDQAGLTPIDLAIQKGYTDCLAAIFLSQRADSHKPDPNDLPYLHRAVLYQPENTQLIEQLIKLQPDLQARDSSGKTALHIIAEQGYTNLLATLCQTLQEKNALDLASCDNQGRTPLHLAVSKGNLETVQYLLRKKASLSIRDKDGLTPIDHALRADHIALIKLLLAIPGCSPLQVAAEQQDMGLLQQLLEIGIDINTMDRQGKTALYVACGKGDIDFIKTLLGLGAQVDAADQEGKTLLHRAIINNDTVVVSWLLKAGAKLALADQQGYTSLHWAAQYNRAALAAYLIAAGAAVEAKDSLQRTPLHVAAYHNHPDVVRVLIRAGANLQATDSKNHTPSCMAMEQGSLAVVEAIVAATEYRIHAQRCAEKLSCQAAADRLIYEKLANLPGNMLDQPLYAEPEVEQDNMYGVESFFKNYLIALPTEQQEPLHKKFAAASLDLQEKILGHFLRQGYFYPTILTEFDSQEWIQESLILELCKEAILEKDSLAVAKFHNRLKSATLGYSIQEIEKLLQLLQQKQVSFAYNLNQLTDILTYLAPFKARQAFAYLQLTDTAWLTSLRLAWVIEKSKCLQHFTPGQRSQLSYASSLLVYEPELLDKYMVSLEKVKYFPEVADFLSFLTKTKAPSPMVAMAFQQKPLEAEKSRVRAWKRYIACELLKLKLAKLYPDHVQPLGQQLEQLLAQNWIYEEMDTTLDALLERPASHTAINEAICFGDLLNLLFEYKVSDLVCDKALTIIRQQPPTAWESGIHALVISATFGKSRERSLQEIIDYITAKSPGASFANDPVALQSHYAHILEAYQSYSQLLPFCYQVIAQWGKEEIAAWAKVVQGSAAMESLDLVTQYEVLAVVKRGVEIYYGYAPRVTQLLALALLLNHAPGKGRLAQINTGEGKSLVVAMLAIIHALSGKKVDVVTSSTELSVPEANKQEGFCALFGLSVGENSVEGSKRAVYEKDIVYGTAADFQGDVLRSEFLGDNIRDKRGFGIVIVDEVDNMLFDSRTSSIRLSGSIPGMHHLEGLLAAVYSQVAHTIRHMLEKDATTYYIEEDFTVIDGELHTASGEVSDIKIVEDKEAFIAATAENHFKKVLRTLDVTEQQEWEALKRHQEGILEANFALQRAINEEDKKQKEAYYLALNEQIKELGWVKNARYPVIEVPKHLCEFALKQVPLWIHSAINAIGRLQRELHYDVSNGDIVPIDYNNTGVLQRNMVWGDGLAQMLQIKEGLAVKPESIATNFISIPGFFKRYNRSIYGLTGTLGNEATQEFLAELYNTDQVSIPPYKLIPIAGNEQSAYSCKELPVVLVAHEQAWYQTLCHKILREVRNKRAVLVILKYIDEVKKLAELLEKDYHGHKITTYTGQEKFSKDHIYAGEIIVATNISGRGTDITTDAVVEEHGGMHVIVGFLPETWRTELQNVGRTARQGKKGSAQLIMRHPSIKDIAILRQERDEKETCLSADAKDEVGEMLLRDRLFSKFCALEASLLPKGMEKNKVRQILEDQFLSMQQKYQADLPWIRENLVAEVAKGVFEKIYGHKKLTLADPIGQDIYNAVKQQLYQTISQKVLDKQLESELIDQFCANVPAEIPRDVLEHFRERKTDTIDVSSLASKYGWGAYEHDGLAERWGIWLKHALEEGGRNDEVKAKQKFSLFSWKLRQEAERDALIANPYYYVLKGNSHVCRNQLDKAVKTYNRAIALDNLYSLNARYNKARALLKYKKNKAHIPEAKHELQRAKLILVAYYKPNLLNFNNMVSYKDAKAPLIEHLQHQIDILLKQESYIDIALQEIKKAEDQEWNIEVSEEKSLEEVFADADASTGHRDKALAKARSNGLKSLFVLQAKQPFPWGSIIGLALLGIAQVVAGSILLACTGGSLGLGLITEGVSDIITSVKAAIKGQFDWGEWAIQKAISLAVAVFSSGIQGIKDALKCLKSAGSDLCSKVLTGSVKDGFKLAAKQTALTLSKGAAKEMLTAAGNAAIDKMWVEKLEYELENILAEQLEEKLLQSELIQQALYLDGQHAQNAWQAILIREGLALLHKPDSKLKRFFVGVGQGIFHTLSAKSKDVGGKLVQTTLQLMNKGKDLAELKNAANRFFYELEAVIEEKYKARIEQAFAVEKQQASKNNAAQENDIGQMPTDMPGIEQFSTAPELPVGEDIKVVNLDQDGLNYTSAEQAQSSVREYYYGGASSNANLKKTFIPILLSQVTDTIRNSFVQPVTSSFAGMSVASMTKTVTQEINQEMAAYSTFRKTCIFINELGAESKKEKNQANTKKKEKNAANKAVSAGIHSEQSKQRLTELAENAPGNFTDLAWLSTNTDRPIEIYKEGKLYEVLNRKAKGAPIKLGHSPKHGGHWAPIDGSGIGSSGENNCLFDAFVSQLTQTERENLEVHSGQDLREASIKFAQENPHIVHELAQASFLLTSLNNGKYAFEGGSIKVESTKISVDNVFEETRCYIDALQQDTKLDKVALEAAKARLNELRSLQEKVEAEKKLTERIYLQADADTVNKELLKRLWQLEEQQKNLNSLEQELKAAINNQVQAPIKEALHKASKLQQDTEAVQAKVKLGKKAAFESSQQQSDPTNSQKENLHEVPGPGLKRGQASEGEASMYAAKDEVKLEAESAQTAQAQGQDFIFQATKAPFKEGLYKVSKGNTATYAAKTEVKLGTEANLPVHAQHDIRFQATKTPITKEFQPVSEAFQAATESHKEVVQEATIAESIGENSSQEDEEKHEEEAYNAVAPSALRRYEREELQEDLADYQQATQEDAEFQALKAAVTALEEQCAADPTNSVLQDQLALQQTLWEAHPLYEQGVNLGVAAQTLRVQAIQEAEDLVINLGGSWLPSMSRGRHSQITACEKEAAAIKEALVKPLRGILVRSNSPVGTRKLGAFGQGTKENLVEVFKLGEKLVKVSFKLGKSLVTRKDEAGIVAKAQAAKSFLEALFTQTKQDWENPEAYRARLEAAEEIARELRLYDQFHNAEAYHLEESKNLGYISLEAVQFVCGEAIFKGTVKIGKYSVKLVDKVIKVEIVARNVRLLKMFPSVESLIAYAEEAIKLAKSSNESKLHKAKILSKGEKQAYIKGTYAEGEAVFKKLIKGAKRTEKGIGYVLKDGTEIFAHKSKTTRFFTIDINRSGKIYKIRFDPKFNPKSKPNLTPCKKH
jgi:ankyrin repeat protein/preprotein translocase subunit SecA